MRISDWSSDVCSSDLTKLFQISGHVNCPCVVEEAMSIPFRELIDKHDGGIRGGWDNLLAVIPGGSSVPLVPADQIMDAPMDFDGLQELGSGLGTASGIAIGNPKSVVEGKMVTDRGES